MARAGWITGMMMIAVGAVCPAQGGPQQGVEGDWQTRGGSVVRIYACGEKVCAKVVRIEPGAPGATDLKNPDAALRSRPICGLEVGSGFIGDGAGKASDGRLYDPKSGHTYHGSMQVNGDELHLRGYVGISMFGRTEVWHRVGEIGEACKKV